MMKPSCSRVWQVEAARDQRLDAQELAAFEHHRQHCEECQREQRALDALALQLQDMGGQTDRVALRRLRQRTLDRANELTRQEPRRSYRAGVLASCAAAVALIAWTVWPSHEQRAPEVAMVHVEPHQDARWLRTREPNVERVELSAGTLVFRVARKPGDPRLLVRVPDGEIEDLGTVFSVTVAGDKTSEIIVREGQVVFHRSGGSPLHLVEGSVWQAPAEPAPSREVDPTPPRQELATELKKPQHSAVKPVPPAVGASEDAAYLHILALLREGRRHEARLAAFSYLHVYPNGFRAPEVSKVAAMRDPDAPSN